jgi:hypothetical protein
VWEILCFALGQPTPTTPEEYDVFKVAIAAKSAELPRMDVPDTAAFLADVHASNDPEKPIVCGFFRRRASHCPTTTTTTR